MGAREVAFSLTAGTKLFDGNGVRITVLGELGNYDGVPQAYRQTDILRIMETFFFFIYFWALST